MLATCERSLDDGTMSPFRFPCWCVGVMRSCLVLARTRGRSAAIVSGTGIPDYPRGPRSLAYARQRKLYVPAAEQRQFQAYLRNNLDSRLADESLSLTRRFAMLNEVVRDVLGEHFDKGTSTRRYRRHPARTAHGGSHLPPRTPWHPNFVACCTTTTTRSPIRPTSHTIARCWRKNSASTDKETLNRIATGALLHDLGKLEISEAILTKNGKLSDTEFAVIKHHPTDRLLKLCHRDDLEFGQLMMVYQHHERMDGRGYPTEPAAAKSMIGTTLRRGGRV